MAVDGKERASEWKEKAQRPTSRRYGEIMRACTGDEGGWVDKRKSFVGEEEVLVKRSGKSAPTQGWPLNSNGRHRDRVYWFISVFIHSRTEV